MTQVEAVYIRYKGTKVSLPCQCSNWCNPSGPDGLSAWLAMLASHEPYFNPNQSRLQSPQCAIENVGDDISSSKKSFQSNVARYQTLWRVLLAKLWLWSDYCMIHVFCLVSLVSTSPHRSCQHGHAIAWFSRKGAIFPAWKTNLQNHDLRRPYTTYEYLRSFNLFFNLMHHPYHPCHKYNVPFFSLFLIVFLTLRNSEKMFLLTSLIVWTQDILHPSAKLSAKHSPRCQDVAGFSSRWILCCECKYKR